MRQRAARGCGCVDTIYFGGGTPSLLEPADLRRIIAGAPRGVVAPRAEEVTLEADPETITPEKARRGARRDSIASAWARSRLTIGS